MNSGEKKARIVCRMKSVEATRVMPSRCATSAATVDFPVPVEPPISTTIGTSSDLQVREPAEPPDRAARPPSSPSTSRASSSSRSTSIAEIAALGEIELDPPRELVGVVGRDAGRDQRARHQPLRIRKTVVPERQRLAVAALRHALHRRERERAARRVPARPRRSRRARRACRGRAHARRRRRSQRPSARRGTCRPRRASSSRSATRFAEVGRDVHDVGVEMRDVARARGEDRDAAFERLRSAREPQLEVAPTTTSEISRR